jgi:hypothetical protein
MCVPSNLVPGSYSNSTVPEETVSFPYDAATKKSTLWGRRILRDKASLQQANDQEFPIPVMATDLAGQLRDTPVDGLFIEYHPGRIPFH